MDRRHWPKNQDVRLALARDQHGGEPIELQRVHGQAIEQIYNLHDDGRDSCEHPLTCPPPFMHPVAVSAGSTSAGSLNWCPQANKTASHFAASITSSIRCPPAPKPLCTLYGGAGQSRTRGTGFVMGNLLRSNGFRSNCSLSISTGLMAAAHDINRMLG
jgi:hypothetical protein